MGRARSGGRRRRTAVGLVAVGGVAVVGGLASCGTVIVPPADPIDPTPVFIADYGIHASLILPRSGGGEADAMVEYAYGEWEWYALSRNQWYRAPAALFSPSEGALGRRALAGPVTAASVELQTGPEQVLVVTVGRREVEALVARLDARFAAGMDRRVFNQTTLREFVPDPEAYSIRHNCNTVLASWVREIGAEVPRVCWTADFSIRPPAAAASGSGSPPGPR
jgi:hypothetical protein